MQYTDPVYGTFVITDPLVLELIASPSLVRLKDIDSGGYPEPHFPGKPHSRFDHSMGVYLLLRRYNASREEQIAGLLHDVSHSAFSHSIDYVLPGGSGKEQSHQDNVFETFVRKSEIPSVLTKHGIDLEYILDDANFPLKETTLPNLCADRLDYSLRHAVLRFGMDANTFLDHLFVEERQWVFDSAESACQFAEYFRRMNMEIAASIGSAVMLETVAAVLRHALAKEYIVEADLYTTDALVLDKIRSHLATDIQLQLFYNRVDGKIGYRNDPKNYDAHVYVKSRIVDPLCRHDGARMRLSEVQPDWRDVVSAESKPKEYFIKFDR